MTWIKQPKWQEVYFYWIEKALKLLRTISVYASMQSPALLYH